MNKIVFLFFLIFAKNSIGQVDSGYYYLNLLQYKNSINYLKKNIKKNAYIKYENGNTTTYDVDMFNLACTYSLAKQYKNCMKQLNMINKNKTNPEGGYYPNQWSPNNYYNYIDADFYRVSVALPQEWKIFLINHKKTCSITDTVFKKMNMHDSTFIQLMQISINDQAHYREINFYEDKYGAQSSVVVKLWKNKDSLDKANLKLVLYYLDNGYNVLSDSVVGKFAKKCFLVIQHADLKTQKKYLPIIKKLYDRKQISGESYALLYDRISVDETQGKQYYGTQINSKTNLPFFIIDENNLENRREQLGMESMVDYCKRFGIIYIPKIKK